MPCDENAMPISSFLLIVIVFRLSMSRVCSGRMGSSFLCPVSVAVCEHRACTVLIGLFLRWALWRLARWQNILQWQLKDPEGFDVHWVFIVYTWLAHTGARPAMLLRATLRNDATCLVDVTRRTFHKYNLILFDWCHWSKLCFLVFWDWSCIRVCIYHIHIYASSIYIYMYICTIMYIYV